MYSIVYFLLGMEKKYSNICYILNSLFRVETVFNVEFKHFCIYFRSGLSGCSGSLFIATDPKAKYEFLPSAILLSYIFFK
jgi:hypothetical protein